MPKVTIKTPDSTVEVDATTLKDISRVCRENGIPFKLNYKSGKPIYGSFSSR